MPFTDSFGGRSCCGNGLTNSVDNLAIEDLSLPSSCTQHDQVTAWTKALEPKAFEEQSNLGTSTVWLICRPSSIPLLAFRVGKQRYRKQVEPISGIPQLQSHSRFQYEF